MIGRCCYLVGVICVISLFLFSCFFHIVSVSSCEGEWGVGNLGDLKNGIGKCEWKFGITSTLTNSSLFLRETVYEGGWSQGSKHGFGKYKSFSNIVYEGLWKDNKRQGDGIMTVNDKTRYTGQWDNDTLTCDEATLTLFCNGGTITYKGKVTRGLPHGPGTITFSDSPRKIQLTFHHGAVLDHSRGVLILSDGHPIQIDSFRETWGFLQQTYAAQGELSHTSPSGKRTSYMWDGERVVVDDKAWVGAQNSTTHTQGGEVYELLNALRWFEYHFMKTQMMLESEVYVFDTPEQHEKERERKAEGQLKDRVTNKEDKVEL